jgi:AraC-like DNA-binding protein
VTQAPWRGRIFLDAGALLYVGPGASGELHAHNAVQLVWSCDGAFEISAAGRNLRRSAVLVPSAAAHALDATGRAIATLLVESHDARGAALDAAARRADYGDVTAALAEVSFPSHDLAAHDVAAQCERVLAALGATARTAPITAITGRAISYIEHHLDGVPRVADVARQLSVSPTRVTHQFTSEVGIPFRRFVLWTRIKRAVEVHRAGRDLTTAAIEAGFSDAAHFSRTFRAMFGLSPSLVLPVAEIIGRAWR